MAQLCEEMNYDGPQFYDSGLAALDAHKEELYAFVLEVSQAHPDGNPISLIKKAQSITNQIEKEK